MGGCFFGRVQVGLNGNRKENRHLFSCFVWAPKWEPRSNHWLIHTKGRYRGRKSTPLKLPQLQGSQEHISTLSQLKHHMLVGNFRVSFLCAGGILTKKLGNWEGLKGAHLRFLIFGNKPMLVCKLRGQGTCIKPVMLFWDPRSQLPL